MMSREESISKAAIAALFLLLLGIGEAFAQRSVVVECRYCSENDRRLMVEVIGPGDHHIYDLGYGVLKRYLAVGGSPIPLGADGPGNNPADARPHEGSELSASTRQPTPLMSSSLQITSVPVDPQIAAIVAEMQALQNSSPGYFDKSLEEVPIGVVGTFYEGPGNTREFSPAGVGLGVPIGGLPASPEYNRFMESLEATLNSNPSNLSPWLGGIMRVLGMIEGLSVAGAGLNWAAYSAMVTLTLRDANGNYVVVTIDPKARTITYRGAYHSSGAGYPPRNIPGGTSFELPFPSRAVADDFLDDLANHNGGCRNCPGLGLVQYIVVCGYVDGRLDTCHVEVRPL